MNMSVHELQLAKADQVHDELKKAGVTGLGLIKFSSRYLAKVLHEDEHVHAAANGRYHEIHGQPFNAAIMVATDERVLFLDHKPGYTSLDEIQYENISGYHVALTPWFAAFTLFTRSTNYALTFARRACIEKLEKYIETMQHAHNIVSHQVISR